ncbi:MAG: threonine ammonia-lyase IlvA [Acidimicrobiales bacterium]
MSEAGAVAELTWRQVLDLDAVRAAAARLAPLDLHTPLQRNARLSERYGAEILLKREDLQAVRSYKIRGAYNFVAALPGGPPAAGVVCASAGNHAQGMAWTCRHLGVRGTVYLPRRTPRQKVDRIRSLGGDLVDVRFAGDTFDDAAAAASDYATATGATVVPAFDHPATVSGQGTVALEVVEQLGDAPDVFLVPIGGGGLIAGIAACLEGLGAPTRIVGVQPAGAPAMVRSIAAGRPITIDIEDDFIDGAAVRTPGLIAVAVTSELVDDIHCVPEGQVCTALLELYQDDGIVAEPAGALSVAVLDMVAPEIEGKTVVCMLSGGNNDVGRYDEIIERSLVHRGLKHYFIIEFPQQPGSLRRFLDDSLGPLDDITLFEYLKRGHREFGAAIVGIELAERAHLEPLLDRMAASGLTIDRLDPGSAAYRYLI